jgi:hypothetical protein
MQKLKKSNDDAVREAAMLRGAVDPHQEQHVPFDFDSFQFNTIEDFDVYNDHVRKHNRFCLHERNKMRVKIPDESFHKKVKIKFNRFEQRENVLKVRIRNKEIDWTGQLKPGGTYELPIPVVKFLNALAIPIFEEVKISHGDAVHTETKQTGEIPRFSCSVIDF